MDNESINYNRYRWNRMLMNGFWCILMLTIVLECLYLTVTAEPAGHFIQHYIIKPSVLQLATLLFAESLLRFLKGKYQDYILIFISTMLSFIIVFIHNSISYLLLALFLPVMVSIFYFQIKKLAFALFNTLSALYLLYWTNDLVNDSITIAGMTTITVMFCVYTLVAWGILSRGRELLEHLKSYFESHQQLLMKTIWMDKLAKTDALTELYNHITFHEYFERLIDQNERNGLPLQLAIVDIDNFKQVNDTYGHRAGDAVLKAVAEIINSNAGMNDFIARYGGEEFAVLYTEKTHGEAYAVVERMREEIAKAVHESLNGKPVTVSAGFAEYVTGEGKERFFNRVDGALYKAKSTGKNRVVLASYPWDDFDGRSRLA